MSERDLDVIVLGATGVTGRRVCAYLAERAAELQMSWAAVGRDPDRTQRVLEEEGLTELPEILTADVGDRDSLDEIARRATVVLNLVGPYTTYAPQVIAACVEGGAHYADLTGEMQFARRVIDRHHDEAAAAGVKIVQTCGFEALPPDLAVGLADATARERHGEPLATADVRIGMKLPAGRPRASDAISGGTFQSLRVALADDESERLLDPAVLVPDPAMAESIRHRSPIEIGPRVDDGRVIAPMAPSAYLNPAVVHRSAALRAEREQEPLRAVRYREGLSLGGSAATLPLRYAAAAGLSGMQASTKLLARAPGPARKGISAVLERFGPSSGYGPDADRIEDWRWTLTCAGTTRSGHEVTTVLRAEGHPGYLATARLFGEAGLLLADEGATPDAAGCLTPSTALGVENVGRFDAARLRFRIED